MLAKKYKLPVGDFFKKKLKKKKSDFFDVFFSESGLKFSRFGVLIGKKFSAKAVERNKFKRIVFETVRKKEFFKKPGKDVLISLFPIAKKASREEFEKKIIAEAEEILN